MGEDRSFDWHLDDILDSNQGIIQNHEHTLSALGVSSSTFFNNQIWPPTYTTVPISVGDRTSEAGHSCLWDGDVEHFPAAIDNNNLHDPILCASSLLSSFHSAASTNADGQCTIGVDAGFQAPPTGHHLTSQRSFTFDTQATHFPASHAFTTGLSPAMMSDAHGRESAMPSYGTTTHARVQQQELTPRFSAMPSSSHLGIDGRSDVVQALHATVAADHVLRQSFSPAPLSRVRRIPGTLRTYASSSAAIGPSSRWPCEWEGGCDVPLDDVSAGGIERHLRDKHIARGWDRRRLSICRWCDGGRECNRPVTLGGLGKHVASMHLRTMTAHCEACGGTFSRHDVLQKHQRTSCPGATRNQ